MGFNMKHEGSAVETIDGKSVRVINDLDWVETSTVVRGASPETQTISAKSNEVITAPDTADETASGTDVDVDQETTMHEYGNAELELLKQQLRLAKAMKEA